MALLYWLNVRFQPDCITRKPVINTSKEWELPEPIFMPKLHDTLIEKVHWFLCCQTLSDISDIYASSAHDILRLFIIVEEKHSPPKSV